MERKIVEIAWEITDCCNYSCIHCYNPRKRNDLRHDEVVDVLKQAKNIAVEKIKYGGGEPLLRADFLDVLGETISMGFDTTFSTNGFLVTRELAERIKETSMDRIQVSLDGNKDIHNYIRNNLLAYQRATEAIGLFADLGFKVSVATTLIKPNLGCLEEIFDTCTTLGVNRWRVMKYIPVSRKDLTPSVQEYESAHEKLLLLKNKDSKMEVYVAREFDEVCDVKDRFDSECFGGRSAVSIRANGDVSPCSYFPDFVIGNLRQKSLNELWQSEKMKAFANEIYGNRDCQHFKNCQGGCKAASLYITGRKECDAYCGVKSQKSGLFVQH